MSFEEVIVVRVKDLHLMKVVMGYAIHRFPVEEIISAVMLKKLLKDIEVYLMHSCTSSTL